jgi:PTH1 family peptidyl-tRNA hydrolase
LALDFYFKLNGYKWSEKPKFGAIHGEETIDGEKYIFLKPQDYYNESGKSVREFMRYHNLALSDILVICDDFNLEFGKIRYRLNGSAGGNNGLKSIIASLGTEKFPRLRIGTGNDELRKKLGDVDFVLSKFTPEEKEKLPEILREVAERI